MTPAQCRKLIQVALNQRGISTWSKLTAKTMHFCGDSKIFVTVHGWQPNPVASELKRIGHEHGFCVSFTGNFVQS
jgi:hypothetical protein